MAIHNLGNLVSLYFLENVLVPDHETSYFFREEKIWIKTFAKTFALFDL